MELWHPLHSPASWLRTIFMISITRSMPLDDIVHRAVGQGVHGVEPALLRADFRLLGHQHERRDFCLRASRKKTPQTQPVRPPTHRCRQWENPAPPPSRPRSQPELPGYREFAFCCRQLFVFSCGARILTRGCGVIVGTRLIVEPFGSFWQEGIRSPPPPGGIQSLNSEAQ